MYRFNHPVGSVQDYIFFILQFSMSEYELILRILYRKTIQIKEEIILCLQKLLGNYTNFNFRDDIAYGCEFFFSIEKRCSLEVVFLFSNFAVSEKK